MSEKGVREVIRLRTGATFLRHRPIDPSPLRDKDCDHPRTRANFGVQREDRSEPIGGTAQGGVRSHIGPVAAS